ncbi:acyl-CoA dehydrogenase [Mycolicibacterium conceptionense]|uniref:Acyl-CoA dehydrogenase n=1 Tax=Mycolicibacterium conceptionense TaxID=451644 RepID=A0A0U1CV89_9MYCO|nr:acyl-CoA dehydrogenase [Mycolicibacterium conceptionense]
MDFQLTDEQTLLADTTRDLLSGYDTEKRNKVVEAEPGFDRQIWGQLAEVGVLGLGFDEDSGGQIEIMVVLNELGRRLHPSRCCTERIGPAHHRRVGTDAQRAAVTAGP